jgi:Tfp pilus assembly protein FimT
LSAFARSRTGLRTRSGVTLIELMVVVAIIIIMSAGAAIAVGQNERNTLRASALEVQALVDRARQTALAQRSPTCIVVSPADGTFSFYATPVPSGTDPFVSGTIVQKVVLRGGVGLPVQRAVTITGEPLSAYFNKAITTATPQVPYAKTSDYIYTDTARKIRIWFDGFGHPDVDPLPNASTPSQGWPAAWATSPQRSFGWVTLTVGSGSLAVQVVMYANSGTSELRWIGK